MTFGVQIVATLAILLTAMAVRSTELYAGRYQTLPMLDWLESRQPLTEADHVPSAIDLAHGAARALPLLVIRSDASTVMPVFGPPSSVQRVVGGVRDAARIVFGTPGDYRFDQLPIAVRLDVVVFNRELRAADWTDLYGRAMDIRDPDSGLPQARVGGPDEPDAVWIAEPGPDQGGVATVVGHRGVIGFVLQVTYLHDYTADAAHLVDLSARAEALARQTAGEWPSWAMTQKSA